MKPDRCQHQHLPPLGSGSNVCADCGAIVTVGVGACQHRRQSAEHQFAHPLDTASNLMRCLDCGTMLRHNVPVMSSPAELSDAERRARDYPAPCRCRDTLPGQLVGEWPVRICLACGTVKLAMVFAGRCATCVHATPMTTILGSHLRCAILSPAPAVSPMSDQEDVHLSVTPDFGCVLWQMKA